ncbi:MAG: VWA domain-containing protein, partial [Bacteroidota bacterium]|nr:VWA domain-containing protein [Candidatus Kapabacteria bacterium]MDW8221180.1 VWA domain-containing protein [Bacteroidota bacterium]
MLQVLVANDILSLVCERRSGFFSKIFRNIHPLMESYSFSIHLPWWLTFLFGITAAALSWYAYTNITPPVSPARRYILMALRFLALLLLLFVLCEPVLNILRATQEPPRIAILLDNSESMSLTDATRNRKQDYHAVLQALAPEKLNNAVYDAQSSLTLFDYEARIISAQSFTPDSLHLDGQFTNIAKALQSVLRTADRTNTQAVLLVTDGAFNDGENPLYTAELLGRPIVVIGVGDSTEVKDISIRSIITNEVGYVDSELPVNVTIDASGFSNGLATITLRDNGTIVAEQSIPIRTAESRTVHFAYTPKQPGIHTLTAEITNRQGLEGELTTKNNTYSEFVNILSNKRKTILLASQVSPDIAFIRSSLEAQRTTVCSAYIEDGKGGFLDDVSQASNDQLAPIEKKTLETLRRDLSSAEAIILVGFPASSTPSAVIEALKTELARGKPVLFVASQDLDWLRLRPLEPFLPFTVLSGSKQEMLALPDVKQSALASPVMKLSGTESDVKAWNQLPPIFRTETLVRVKPEAEILATIKLNNMALAEPLIVQRTLNNSKSLAILGYGLYRWKLLGYAAELAKGRDIPDIFGLFLENSLRWLSTSDQGKIVR